MDGFKGGGGGGEWTDLREKGGWRMDVENPT